jgi:Ethanolamine utilization protein EutJ (predicted chaperonin)
MQLNVLTIPDRTTAATRVTMTIDVVAVVAVGGGTTSIVVVVDGIMIVDIVIMTEREVDVIMIDEVGMMIGGIKILKTAISASLF